MNFKVGDVIVNKLYSKKDPYIFLILEINHENKTGKIFVLNHSIKSFIRKKHSFYGNQKDFILLQDKVFKSR